MLKKLTRRFSSWTLPITLARLDIEDHPLVFVNEAFCRLTEYSADEVLGRNCRFLQCEGTDRGARSALRLAIETSTHATVCLLNRTRTGREFHNLLIMTPILAGDGTKVMMGCQFELSRSTSAHALKAHLLGLNAAIAAGVPLTPVERMQVGNTRTRADNASIMAARYLDEVYSVPGDKSA